MDFIFVVVISNSGKVIGKSRKNHIPRVGDFNEVFDKSQFTMHKYYIHLYNFSFYL